MWQTETSAIVIAAFTMFQRKNYDVQVHLVNIAPPNELFIIFGLKLQEYFHVIWLLSNKNKGQIQE